MKSLPLSSNELFGQRACGQSSSPFGSFAIICDSEAGSRLSLENADGEPSLRRWGRARCGSRGGRGSESGAQKALPGEGRGGLPWLLVGCLITAGLSLPPHYHRQGYCCDYCYYGDDDGYDGQTAAGGGAGGSGTTGLPRSAIRAGSADRAGGSARTGGSGFTLGPMGPRGPSSPAAPAAPVAPAAPAGPWEPRAPQARRPGRPRSAGGADCVVAVRLNPFPARRIPRRMGLGVVHIVNLEGYPAGGAVDTDVEFFLRRPP